MQRRRERERELEEAVKFANKHDALTTMKAANDKVIEAGLGTS
jgi:hypothetical protein